MQKCLSLGGTAGAVAISPLASCWLRPASIQGFCLGRRINVRKKKPLPLTWFGYSPCEQGEKPALWQDSRRMQNACHWEAPQVPWQSLPRRSCWLATSINTRILGQPEWSASCGLLRFARNTSNTDLSYATPAFAGMTEHVVRQPFKRLSQNEKFVSQVDYTRNEGNFTPCAYL